MAKTYTCDVRIVPPRDRHPLIFSTLESLAPGDEVILINDHDPRPVYYQMQAEWPGRYEWTYLEQGPVDWKVRIQLAPAPQV